MSSYGMPSKESKNLAIAGWLLAGIPVFASGVQAVARLIGVPVGSWPLFGAIADVVHSVEIFRLMSLAFESSESIVLILFVLISLSLVLVGISLFRPETKLVNYNESFHRSVSMVAAVLFALLFASVYSDLWVRDITLGQRGVVVLFPLSTFGGIFTAYSLQPQSNGYRILDKAEETVKSELEDFNQQVDELESDLADLNPDFEDTINADGIITPRRERAFEDVLSKIEEYRERSITETEREKIARELKEDDVAGLDGEVEYEDVETNVRRELADEYRSQFANLTIKSAEFDRPYEFINDEEYRVFEVMTSTQSDWNQINVNKLGEIGNDIEEGEGSIADVVTVINATQEHIQEIKNDIETNEEEFVQIYEETTGCLDEIQQRIYDLPGDVGSRMEKIFIHGKTGDYDTIGMIQTKYGARDDQPGKLDQALDELHDTFFDDARDIAEEAKAMAENLNQVIKFIEHLIDASEDGVSGVEVKDLSHTSYHYFDHSLFENEIASRLNGVRMVCDWEEGRIGLNYTADSHQDDTTVSTSESSTEENGDVPYSRIERGVEFVLDGITSKELGIHEDNLVVVKRANLPGIYDHEEILEETADHLADQDELITDIKRDSLPDHLEFEIDPDERFRTAMETSTDRYKSQSK